MRPWPREMPLRILQNRNNVRKLRTAKDEEMWSGITSIPGTNIFWQRGGLKEEDRGREGVGLEKECKGGGEKDKRAGGMDSGVVRIRCMVRNLLLVYELPLPLWCGEEGLPLRYFSFRVRILLGSDMRKISSLLWGAPPNPIFFPFLFFLTGKVLNDIL